MGRLVLGKVAALLAPGAAFFWCRLAAAQPAPEPVVLEESPSATPAAQPAPPPPWPEPTSAAPPRRPGARTRMPDPGFVDRASPWVDFSLASFYMKDRVGNFLNFGAQAGAYLFKHLRLSARVVVPLEDVHDSYDNSDFVSTGGSFQLTNSVDSRNMSVLYGASLGLVVSNDRSFVFGPNIGFARTDVEDYGTAVLVGLPFEWTTSSNLRVGFELSVGHASGGSALQRCTTSGAGVTVSCGSSRAERQGGTAFVLSYSMGWSLGRL